MKEDCFFKVWAPWCFCSGIPELRCKKSYRKETLKLILLLYVTFLMLFNLNHFWIAYWVCNIIRPLVKCIRANYINTFIICHVLNDILLKPLLNSIFVCIFIYTFVLLCSFTALQKYYVIMHLIRIYCLMFDITILHRI